MLASLHGRLREGHPFLMARIDSRSERESTILAWDDLVYVRILLILVVICMIEI